MNEFLDKSMNNLSTQYMIWLVWLQINNFVIHKTDLTEPFKLQSALQFIHGLICYKDKEAVWSRFNSCPMELKLYSSAHMIRS